MNVSRIGDKYFIEKVKKWILGMCLIMGWNYYFGIGLGFVLCFEFLYYFFLIIIKKGFWILLIKKKKNI